MTITADMVIVFMNSARKKRANRIEEYSVWNPPTNSCSASTRSNGGRLSSAVAAIRNTTNGTKKVTHRFHLKPTWPDTMALVCNEPDCRNTARTGSRAKVAAAMPNGFSMAA